MPDPHRIYLAEKFTNQLSLEQQEDLERNITIEEIKRAVCTFPRGCNSSFIALIPKTQNAKVVKYFRPIRLIGSIYKIIAKILVNRLSFIIADLIIDVQSAFVSNRQILDGPFILNELLSWCKHKKFKATVFKVDFEKAFDSIRLDYLEDVLKKFSFGDKWCGWINCFLKSAMRSVLVNGSPTSEFQFYKGLKQGDPLSPFLFILIMESLHLSFKKVMNAGMFVGNPLDNSVTVSHLFDADDAIFVGKWDTSNINTILKVLKCFHMASGLKINLHKSKLMVIGVHSEEVEIAARYMGCATFSTPFTHLVLRTIKAIYGESDSLDSLDHSSRRSPWLDIEDIWLDEVILKQKYPCLYALELDKRVTVADKLNHSSLVWSYHQDPKGGIEEEQQRLLHSCIGGVILPNMLDRWVWSLEASGEFSVKSVRSHIDDTLLPKEDVRTRWVNVVPIKINVFAWRVRLDILPT
ncbi:RNA-directed DNA polymerase, eukaryota [Tanacetum coccineum]